MTKDEALRLALEALETSMYPQQKQLQAITAIKAALEAKDEPDYSICPTCGGMADDPIVPCEHRFQSAALEAKDEPVAQPEVRTGNCLRVGVCASEGHKIQPQRKPLMDEEITEIFSTTKGLDFYLNFARAIEAAHGITGENK